MHDVLLDQTAGKYHQKHLRELEALEEQLTFSEFNSKIAFELGEAVIKKVPDEATLTVQIIRLSDEAIIFQYISDKGQKRNLDFAYRKYQTTLLTGHSSIWALIREQVSKDCFEQFGSTDFLPVSGAFPITVKGQMEAIICVSGLKNGGDFAILVEGISDFLGCLTPSFTGYLI